MPNIVVIGAYSVQKILEVETRLRLIDIVII